mgnify:CR=1 FL=1
MDNQGTLVVVSGFSGAGKGTVMKALISKYENYALSISATTRAPREGEENGREDFFKTREEFEEMIREDQLVEYAQYVENYYGTPKKYVFDNIEAGKDVLLEIEIGRIVNVLRSQIERCRGADAVFLPDYLDVGAHAVDGQITCQRQGVQQGDAVVGDVVLSGTGDLSDDRDFHVGELYIDRRVADVSAFPDFVRDFLGQFTTGLALALNGADDRHIEVAVFIDGPDL